jgi:hypothetical protein
MSLQLITSDIQTLPMQSCSKYEACSVNICPLDPDWKLRTHLQGEPSCHYLRLVVKGAATPEEQSSKPYQAASELWNQRDQLPTVLVSQLEKASQTKRKVFPAVTSKAA